MTKNSTRNKSLEELLARRGTDPEAYAEQRANFAYASAQLDGYSIARQSARLLGGETTATTTLLTGDELATKATKNAILQFELVTRWAAQSAGHRADVRGFLDEAALKSLHRVGMEGLIAEAGEYRSTGIAIEGRDIGLPAADEVPKLVEELTTYLVENWNTSSVGHLAAYALWRHLWIHPFLDGNGRVGRALAYLILCLKAGGPLPGTPTMPELLASDRGAYYDALTAADNAFQAGKADVSALRKLVERAAALQLTNTPILSSFVEDRLERTVRQRILGTPSDIRRYLYAGDKVEWRVWQVGSYILLYAASSREIGKAVHRQEETGSPFPGLLSSGRGVSNRLASVSIFQGATISEPIFLAPDTPAVFSRTRVHHGRHAYEIPGTIYSIRLGISNSISNVDRTLDTLVARHLTVVTEGRRGASNTK